MMTSMTRPCFTTQHQTRKTKTKTDFLGSQTGFVPRPTVSDHITESIILVVTGQWKFDIFDNGRYSCSYSMCSVLGCSLSLAKEGARTPLPSPLPLPARACHPVTNDVQYSRLIRFQIVYSIISALAVHRVVCCAVIAAAAAAYIIIY